LVALLFFHFNFSMIGKFIAAVNSFQRVCLYLASCWVIWDIAIDSVPLTGLSIYLDLVLWSECSCLMCPDFPQMDSHCYINWGVKLLLQSNQSPLQCDIVMSWSCAVDSSADDWFNRVGLALVCAMVS
jgi:hypothetical protein